MSFLDNVTKGPIARKRRTLLYGVHGIGKTTWASKWDNPVFITLEDGSNDLDVTRTQLLTTARDCVSAIKEVIESDYGTLVLDSIDWLEKLIEKDLRSENFNTAFGQGMVEVARRISAVLTLLDKAVQSGKHVVLIGHSHVRAVTQPDGTSWSRYEPKLTKHSCAVVSEWCDEMLFANTVVATQVKTVGMKQVSVGHETGERRLFTVGTPQFEAKHRKAGLQDYYNLSDVTTYLNDIA